MADFANYSDNEIPTLEAAEMPHGAKQSKRYGKAMSKMGLKPEANISKVNIRKIGSLSFAINQPEVYRFPGTNTFVIFGEAQLEDMAALSRDAAARAAVSGAASDIVSEVKKQTAAAATSPAAAPAPVEAKKASTPAPAPAPVAQKAAAVQQAAAVAATEAKKAKREGPVGSDDDEQDAGEFLEKEIEMVMKQSDCRRGLAIRALRRNNGDLVNAIMELAF